MSRYDYEETAPTKAVSDEPEIIRAARMFDEAANDLDNLRAQQKKIGETIKMAQEKMNEAASCIRSCIDISAVAAEQKRLS